MCTLYCIGVLVSSWFGKLYNSAAPDTTGYTRLFWRPSSITKALQFTYLLTSYRATLSALTRYLLDLFQLDLCSSEFSSTSFRRTPLGLTVYVYCCVCFLSIGVGMWLRVDLVSSPEGLPCSSRREILVVSFMLSFEFRMHINN